MANLDNILVLLEEISSTNKTLLEENKELKASLQCSDEANRKALGDLTSKIQSTPQENTPKNVRQRRRQAAKERRGIVPPQCRVSL